MFKPGDLFDLKETDHAKIFEGCEYAWEALPRIQAYVKENVKPGLKNRCDGIAWVGDEVSIGEGTVIEDGVMIKGPAIIGKNCQIRHNAYVRDYVIIGDGCVVGNATEIKNSILFNGAQVPHYNYIGDSILGHRAHLGAGVKISNLKLDGSNVILEIEGKPVDTGLRKFGALLGDQTDVGCNAVLNPGTIVGRLSMIYPNTNWRGVLPEKHIAKSRIQVEIVARR
jgi:NDP-sugar pyrophosphorylase family protein